MVAELSVSLSLPIPTVDAKTRKKALKALIITGFNGFERPRYSDSEIYSTPSAVTHSERITLIT